MKRLIGVILCFSVLMIACNKNKTVNDDNDQILTETNTQKDFPKTMYVNAAEGLRVRNSPSSDGERLGLLSYLTEVAITKEDNNTVNIGGVDGKWVYITEPIKGWVFDGFLEDYDQYTKRIDNIKQKFGGYWKIYKDDGISFWEDEGMKFSGEYYGRERDAFEYGNFRGDWRVINENTIKLNGGWLPETEKFELDLVDDYYLTDINFIDDDHITLNTEVLYYPDNIFREGKKKYFMKLERF